MRETTVTETAARRGWRAFALASVLTGLMAGSTGAALAASPADRDRSEADAAVLARKEVQRRLLEDRKRATDTPTATQRGAFVPCVDGFADVYPCQAIDLMAFMPLSAIGGGEGNDIWGWTDPVTGREYALMGRTTGTAAIDITDPTNPVYVANMAGRGAPSSWRDIKVYADHAYVVSESSGHGMQVFDLTGLRDIASPPGTLAEAAHYDDFGSAHNIAINEETGFAYAVGTGTCSGGPHFIDLANPIAPTFAGCHIETIYTHDTQCVVYQGPDTIYQGREVCFNSNEDKINIIDVTDHATSSLISETTYTGVAYTHQGWLTEDHRYWLQGDELDEQGQGHNTRTRIFDVSDLDAPQLIGTYDGGKAAIDHNLYTLNGYLYQANYRAGLQVFDLADIASGTLTEIASFDIYPSSDSAQFNGAWSVFPYFESGTVVVSGIEQGLFVLRPDLEPNFRLALDTTDVSVCAPGSADVTVDVTPRNNYVGNVQLDASNLPIGADASFAPSQVSVPGTSTLTLSVAGLAPGTYDVSVDGDDGTLQDARPLALVVADLAPLAPGITSPTADAVDVSRRPTLAWTATDQAALYSVEVAVDPAFINVVFSRDTTGTEVIISDPLAPLTTHYLRVTASNACGLSDASAVVAFTTVEVPDLLLVDDDDNSPDVIDAYTAALNALGRDYDLWDTENTDDEPNAAALSAYNTVVWFTGDEFGGAAGPGGGGESALASWLDDSACLLIASQDYFYDRGLTGFMQSHLGVGSASSDVGHDVLTGAGALYGGSGPYTLDFPYTDYTDSIVPDATAETSFIEGSVGAGIARDGALYRTAFWTFGLETIPTADRADVLDTFLSWCDALVDIDGDDDGTSNGDDCAPADGTVWTPAGEATSLVLGDGADDALQWAAPAQTGSSNGVTFDVLRADSASAWASPTCVETADVDTVAADATVPASGSVYFYLIRSRNECGGVLGVASSGIARLAGECP